MINDPDPYVDQVVIMPKIGNNTEGAEPRDTERTEKAEGRKEVEQLKVEESKKERKIGPNGLPAPAFEDSKHHIKIYQGDCLEILAKIPEDTVDLVFADPPYFLSNGGITCHAGRMVSVNKGEGDKSRGADANHEFNRAWLGACQRVLKPNGSIWVSGTAHVIPSVGFAMQQLAFKLLNDISWVKPNPPPNLSCRYFTHATETPSPKSPRPGQNPPATPGSAGPRLARFPRQRLLPADMKPKIEIRK